MIGPLPRRRYDYIAATAAEITHPDIARELQPDKVGFRPYITNEVWERLKSAMRNYRELTAQHAGTKPVEAATQSFTPDGWAIMWPTDRSRCM